MQRWCLVLMGLVVASVLGGCGEDASSKSSVDVITTWAEAVVADDWSTATAMIGWEPERWEKVLRGDDGTDDYTAYALVGDPVVLTASTTAKIQWTRAGDPKPQCMTVEVGTSNRITVNGWSLCPGESLNRHTP
ncbi:hypothetical protein Haur_5239 (plasmid) [Herpetosiphon aurantiacus DSM 785]|uniref:Lipoprotein n=1 Tax=Herpetosiphon aurantiacus (strain ATCC 23779 / DSM 785 / 114-95) TaxID=316274 RepID=A9B952_HERA2|nr:hypothetical protein Haur_5239 [Herpetosiphon aurantiacus DSM 785]